MDQQPTTLDKFVINFIVGTGISLDPIGCIISKKKGIQTIGGNALDIYDNLTMKGNNLGIIARSGLSMGYAIGMTLTASMQGLTQLGSIAYNYFIHKTKDME